VYRVVKERKDSVSQSVAQSRADASSTDDTAISNSDSDEEEKSAEPSLPADQPVFKGHGEPNLRPKELDPSEVNPREVHHVVVPYSQLKYQRMYDWPPEPKYARVQVPPPKPPSSRKSPATRSPASLRRKSFFASSSISLQDDSSPSVRRRSRNFSGDEINFSRRNRAYSGQSSRATTGNTSLAAYDALPAKKKE
jgi:hypothetical protein